MNLRQKAGCTHQKRWLQLSSSPTSVSSSFRQMPHTRSSIAFTPQYPMLGLPCKAGCLQLPSAESSCCVKAASEPTLRHSARLGSFGDAWPRASQLLGVLHRSKHLYHTLSLAFHCFTTSRRRNYAALAPLDLTAISSPTWNYLSLRPMEIVRALLSHKWTSSRISTSGRQEQALLRVWCT